MIYPKIFKKIILILVIISTVVLTGDLTTKDAQALAAPVVDIPHTGISIAEWTKKFAADIKMNWQKNRGKIMRKIIAGQIRKMLLKQGTFVTNWRNYQRKNQDAGSIIARQLIGEASRGVNDDPETAVMCSFLRDGIGLKYKSKRASQEFADIARAFRVDSDSTYKSLVKCDLPTKITVNGVEKDFDIKAWQQDFSQGGWPVWEKLLQDNNNYFGVSKLTSEEIAKQKKAQEQASLNDAIAGNGFVSLTNKNGQIKTPGKILQDTASNLIDQALRCFETADSMLLFATCANNLIVKQLENFRNIGEDVGLLDDGSADNSDATEPDAAADESDTRQACGELCSDSADSMCLVTIPSPAPPSPDDPLAQQQYQLAQEQYSNDLEECKREQIDVCFAQVNNCTEQPGR